MPCLQLSVLGLACLLLLATGALVAEAKCSVEKGMTYYGNPGNFKTIRWPKNSTKYSWRDCCKECKNQSKCKVRMRQSLTHANSLFPPLLVCAWEVCMMQRVPGGLQQSAGTEQAAKPLQLD